MIPKYLTLRNFLSHDFSRINFEKFNMALILGSFDGDLDSSNNAGKSALFEALCWSLTDKSRHKKKNGVVKWDKKSCKVEFEFYIDSALYRVTRIRDKTADESEVALDQWSNKDNKWENISCDTNTATNDKIVKLIGFNYEILANSLYFKQNDISMFATSTPTKRKDILKALLKIEQWDTYQKKAKDHAKNLNTKIEEKSQRLISVKDIEKDIEACKNKIAELKEKIKDANEDYANTSNSLNQMRMKHQNMYGHLAEDEVRLKTIYQELSVTNKRLTEIKVEKSKNKVAIDTAIEELEGIKKKVGALKNRIVDGKGINLEELRTKIITGRTKEKILKESIIELEKEISLSNNCDLCKRPLNKFEIEAIKTRRKKELSDTKSEHNEIQQKLQRAEEKLKEKETLFNDSARAELEKAKCEVRVSKLQSIFDEATSKNRQLAAETVLLEAKDYKKEISELKVKFNKEDKEKLEVIIKEYERKLSELKRQTDKANIEYGSKVNARNDMIKTEKEQKDLQEDIDKLHSEYMVYDKLKEYFGKDGVQAVIIENVIEELENYTNETLSKICNEPTSISIVTQKQNDNGSWAETFDISVKEGGRTDDFDTLSGGGQFRVSLALRLALSSILSKRCGGVVKMLLLDEVATSLDKKGMELFMAVIKKLSESIKILVITHDERLKEKFNEIIVVNKTATGSKAMFV